MEYLIVCFTSFVISIATLLSGFGLGTVLMPVFAIFFPLPIAIAATAIIHLANNLFKAIIVGKYAEKGAVIRFALPAGLTAVIGAYLLSVFSQLPPLYSYTLGSHLFEISYSGFTIGLIVIISALFELIPVLAELSFKKRYLILGGLLSGFFGGLSGNQGILRSAFLIKSGLTKEQFIGVGVVSSIIVDAVRIPIYGWSTYAKKFDGIPHGMTGIIIAASLCAFLGAYIGSKLMDKVTFKAIQLLVGVMLLVLGLCMIVGLI